MTAETTIMEAVQTIVRSNDRLVLQALKNNLEVFLQAIRWKPKKGGRA